MNPYNSDVVIYADGELILGKFTEISVTPKYSSINGLGQTATIYHGSDTTLKFETYTFSRIFTPHFNKISNIDCLWEHDMIGAIKGAIFDNAIFDYNNGIYTITIECDYINF